MKHSIIIPTINQTLLLLDCIIAFRKHERESDYEIIIVDDGSEESVRKWTEKTFGRDEDVTIVNSPENGGFAHAVNLGLKHATGDNLVIINNDVQLIKPILHFYEECYIKNQYVGVIGAKLLYPPGNHIQHAGISHVPGSKMFLHANKHRIRFHPDACKSMYYITVTGALYAIRREAWKDIGSWDESYFLSCEDTDYSLRAWLKGWRVYYNHEIEAIHLEGHTRGATDSAKKQKSAEWYRKERDTLSKFSNDLDGYDLDSMDAIVTKFNTSLGVYLIPQKRKVIPGVDGAPKKLEVGCGDYPQPGYIHLDIRRFKHIDVVCDFGSERLPFEENELDEILSNHSIEHVSWRKLPHVLSEWYRVLKPGGKLFFRTPDLEFICRSYLDGKVTKEHPNDENYIKKFFSPSITPAWWANIKLFAGQDYDGNYHQFAFDFEMAKNTLEKFGFKGVVRKFVTPVFSPGELQIEAFKPQSMSVLVKRNAAIGDVILTTPILRRLRELKGSDALIDIATACPIVYKNNPHVSNAMLTGDITNTYDEIIDLDLCYERDSNRHIIDAFANRAIGDLDFDKRTELFWTEKDRNKVDRFISSLELDPDKCVVVHMARTWKNRTWFPDAWEDTLRRLVDRGYTPIIIGARTDFTFRMEGVYSLFGSLSIHEVAYLTHKCGCFVANDSGMLHVAGTTDTPIVGIFTCAKGEFRLPYRNGKYGGNCICLKPDLPCYGCLHKARKATIHINCDRNDYACLKQITPEKVVDAVSQLLLMNTTACPVVK